MKEKISYDKYLKNIEELAFLKNKFIESNRAYKSLVQEYNKYLKENPYIKDKLTAKNKMEKLRSDLIKLIPNE